MDITNLTPTQLRLAAAIKEQIDRLNKELQKFPGGLSGGATARARRPMSAAAAYNQS